MIDAVLSATSLDCRGCTADRQSDHTQISFMHTPWVETNSAIGSHRRDQNRGFYQLGAETNGREGYTGVQPHMTLTVQYFCCSPPAILEARITKNIQNCRESTPPRWVHTHLAPCPDTS